MAAVGLELGVPQSEVLATDILGYKLNHLALPVGASAAGLGLVLIIAGLLMSGGKKTKAAASPKLSPMTHPGQAASAKPATAPQPAVPPKPPAPPSNSLASLCARSVLANSQLVSWSNGEALASVEPNQQTADGWLIVYGDGGVGSVSVSKVAPPPGLSGAIGIDVTKAGSGSGWFGFRQIVNDVRTLAGENVVVGMWARASAPILTAIGIVQNSDSSAPPRDSWSDLERIGPEWKYYAAETALPALPDVTPGPNAHLVFHLLLPTSGEYKVEVTGLTLAPVGTVG